MGNTWVTDLRHLLDSDGNLPRYAESRLAKQLVEIVADLTNAPCTKPRELNLPCRKRPGHKPCRGKIHAHFESETTHIVWFCPLCDDRGIIHHWQNTHWDKGGRAWLPTISRISYRGGFVNNLDKIPTIKATVLTGEAIRDDLIRAIHDNELLDSSGEYGDPFLGEPVQFDHLVIDHGGGRTEITLYNRAIHLIKTDNEFCKQVHRVCCMIDRRIRQYSISVVGQKENQTE